MLQNVKKIKTALIATAVAVLIKTEASTFSMEK